MLYVVNAPRQYYEKLEKVSKKGESISLKVSSLDNATIIDRLQENSTTINILNLIKEMIYFCKNNDISQTLNEYSESLDKFNLEEWQRELIIKVVIKQIAIYPINASSKLNSIDSSFEESPIGIARDIGGHLAYERLQSNGYIDFIDGDCILTRDYFDDIEDTVEPDTGYIVKPKYPKLFEIPREIEEESNINKKVRTLIKFVRQHYIFNQINKGVSQLHQVAIDRSDRVPPERIHIGGPLLTVKKGLFRQVGGYSRNYVDEDFNFAAKVLTSSQSFKLSIKPVIVFDRSRPDSTDGYGKIEEDTNSNTLDESYLDERSERFLLIHKYQMLALNKEMENISELSQEYELNRTKQYHKELLLRGIQKHKLKSLIKSYLNKNIDVINESEESYFLSNHAWIDLLNIYLPNINLDQNLPLDIKVEKIVAYLEKVLPEMLAELPKEEPDYQFTEESIPSNIMQLAHVESAAYTTLSRFLNTGNDKIEIKRRKLVVDQALRRVNKKVMDLTHVD